MGAILDRADVPITEMQVDLGPGWQFGPRRKQAPEERLMIAVLRDALDCVEKHRSANDRHRRRLFDQAKQWLLAAETAWPYSFEGICEVLDLDAATVRRRVGVVREPQESPRATPDDHRQTGESGNR